MLHFDDIRILIAVPFIFAHGPIDLILVMYEKVEVIKIVYILRVSDSLSTTVELEKYLRYVASI
jgi:hypothetical protein